MTAMAGIISTSLPPQAPTASREGHICPGGTENNISFPTTLKDAEDNPLMECLRNLGIHHRRRMLNWIR
jgi:hypothetical protein